MTPERWQQLQSLLNAALAMPVDDRFRYLAGACAGDTELQHEAESLLAHASAGSGFLSVPGVTVARDLVREISLVGKQLGPYAIKSRLGTGGMGDVYLAEDTRLRRQVAIKALRESGLPSPPGRSRLLREARAAAALNHPHIAAIYDIIEETGDATTPPHIVMEYVEGETLSDRLRNGRLETTDALRFARDIADALASAHGLGIVHRDLKPANLRVTLQKRVKVLDFGLAQRMAAVPTDTSTMTADHALQSLLPRIAGTPGYMSPEQVLGRPVGPPSDVFSLGIVLFEMLSGTRAFPGGDFSTAAEATLMRPVPRVAQAVPDISPPIDGLVARMLDLDAAKRPTADQVLAELQALLPSTGTDFSGPARLSARRSVVGAFVAIMAAVVLVGGVTWWRATHAAIPTRPAIAVVSLVNLSGDPSKDYLGVGIAETLTTSLARLSTIDVISRTSMADATRNADARTVARDVGATLVLQGSVQQSGDRLRANAKLVRPDGSVAWAGDVEAASSDLFVLETRLAAAIIEGLEVPVTASERQTAVSPPTRNDAALEAYWRGLAFLDRDDPANIGLAIASLQRATSLDPRFAAAFGALGEAYRRQYTFGGVKEAIPQANAAISRGLEIDPGRIEVRMSLAVMYGQTGRSAEAAAEFRKIIAQDPENDEAHRRLALVLSGIGKPEDALREYRTAVTLRPQYWRNHQAIGLFYFNQNRLAEAVPAFTRVIELRPDDANAYLQRGAVLQASGNRTQARADFNRSIQLKPNAPAYSNLGGIAFAEKRYADAAQAFSAAITLLPNRAIYHRNLGDAYRKLDRASDARVEYLKAISLTETAIGVNPNDATALSQLAVYEAKVGRSRDAHRHSDDAIARNAKNPDVLFRRGVMLALLGEKPAALTTLQDAVAHGYGIEQLRTEDDLSGLLDVPEFRRLVQLKP